jgi:hypothetical protein
MPASRSVVSVLLRALGDVSLHPQDRPCGRPPAALRPGNDTTVTGDPASPTRQVIDFLRGPSDVIQRTARRKIRCGQKPKYKCS